MIMKKGQILKLAKKEFREMDSRDSVRINGVLHKANRYTTEGYWCTSEAKLAAHIATGDWPVANSITLDTVFVTYKQTSK